MVDVPLASVFMMLVWSQKQSKHLATKKWEILVLKKKEGKKKRHQGEVPEGFRGRQGQC